MRSVGRWTLLALASSAAIALAAAAFVPVSVANRDQLFEIPNGTWARRNAGADIEILPQQMHLALGVRDILVLKNLDDVPQIFGPTLIMPGQLMISEIPDTAPCSTSFAARNASSSVT